MTLSNTCNRVEVEGDHASGSKRVLQESAGCKNCRGRPKRTWIEAVTEDPIKVVAKDWRQKSKNHQDWNSQVTSDRDSG